MMFTSFTVTEGGTETVTWTLRASSSADASYTTSDNISLTSSASTTGSGVTYSASNIGWFSGPSWWLLVLLCLELLSRYFNYINRGCKHL